MRGSVDIILENISFSYRADLILRDISLHIPAGQITVIQGKSGCGKSTLLKLMAGILRPNRGSVWAAGQNLGELSEDEISAWRLRSAGFVFQDANFIPLLTLFENIILPGEFLNLAPKYLKTQAYNLASQLGIEQCLDRYPGQVSGGQLLRAALVRAWVHNPEIIFADEPTGSLDSANRSLVLDLLVAMASQSGRTVVLVTHDQQVAGVGQYLVRMQDGHLLTAPSEGAGVRRDARDARRR